MAIRYLVLVGCEDGRFWISKFGLTDHKRNAIKFRRREDAEKEMAKIRANNLRRGWAPEEGLYPSLYMRDGQGPVQRIRQDHSEPPSQAQVDGP